MEMHTNQASKISTRFAVRKLDFGKGYEIYDTVTGRKIARTWNTHRAPVKAQADRMNAR